MRSLTAKKTANLTDAGGHRRTLLEFETGRSTWLSARPAQRTRRICVTATVPSTNQAAALKKTTL